LAPREFAERLLATQGQVSRERRVVTMLFSDAKGSTAMGEKLDPEDVLEIMDGAFDVLIEPITRYEGALARLMGDGILAFFGAPIAHEDDAERACRAALEILEGAREYAARLEAERGISGFNVRVGIHTGLVVVGEVGSDLRVEYTAMGDAVNLASRMEEAAEPGTVLITDDTHRLIAPLFEAQSLGPMEVRGKAEPVSVYRVLAARAAAGKPRGIEGLESPLVGRDVEFQALREVLERLQAGVGGIVTIVGEAGIGKSRLVAEVQRSAARRSAISLQQSAVARPGDGRDQRSDVAMDEEVRSVRWVEGRCLSYGESMAYLPWVDMLHGLLGLSAEDAPTEVRDALSKWVQGLSPDHFDEVYPFLGRMMSLPLEQEVEERLAGLEPEGLKVLTFRAVERVLERTTGEGPVVLVVEDLHWADPSSLELLEHLLGLPDRASLLLVCALRPYREHGCWRIRQIAEQLYPHRHVDLSLGPLSVDDSEALVGNLLEVEALPRPLRERILDHAEGNPFYVEEVIRSLIDSDVVVYDETTEQWQATRRVDDIAIPDTLQGVLTARIDRLEEQARRVLQTASVIGRIFPYQVLAAIAQGEAELRTCLSALQREEMIRERARVPELEYIFKHHLTREAAYNGLLRRERRRFHRQAAGALERLFPDRVEEQLGLLAHHWEQTGENETAIEYLRRAGEQAAANYANAEAVAYYTRALDLMSEGDLAGRHGLLLAREEVYNLQGNREAQRRDLTALEELAHAVNDAHARAELVLRQSRYAFMTADVASAVQMAEVAVRLAQATQDVGLQVAAYRQLGTALSDSQDYDAAQSALVQAVALARATGLHREEADSLVELAFFAFERKGNRTEFLDCLQTAQAIYDRIGYPRTDARLFFALGTEFLHRGDYDKAEAVFQRALRVSRDAGHRSEEGWSLFALGFVSFYLGDYARAKGFGEQALSLLQETGHPAPTQLALLGLISHLLGDDKAAWEHCQRALLITQAQPGAFVRAHALVVQAHVHLSLGQLAESADAYGEALALWRDDTSHQHYTVEPLAGLARVALADGDPARARAHANEILPFLEAETVDGLWEPGLAFLTCYRVLQANEDLRADDILEQGYRFLQERAAKISDEGERRSYLENVAAHREIVSAYARGRGVAGSEQARGRETKPALRAGDGGRWVRTTEALRGMRTLKRVSEGRRLKPRLLKRSRPTPTDLGRSQPAYAGCAAVAATCSRQDR